MSSDKLVMLARCPPTLCARSRAATHERPGDSTSTPYQCPFPPSLTFHSTAACAKALEFASIAPTTTAALIFIARIASISMPEGLRGPVRPRARSTAPSRISPPRNNPRGLGRETQPPTARHAKTARIPKPLAAPGARVQPSRRTARDPAPRRTAREQRGGIDIVLEIPGDLPTFAAGRRPPAIRLVHAAILTSGDSQAAQRRRSSPLRERPLPRLPVLRMLFAKKRATSSFDTLPLATPSVSSSNSSSVARTS